MRFHNKAVKRRRTWRMIIIRRVLFFINYSPIGHVAIFIPLKQLLIRLERAIKLTVYVLNSR